MAYRFFVSHAKRGGCGVLAHFPYKQSQPELQIIYVLCYQLTN